MNSIVNGKKFLNASKGHLASSTMAIDVVFAINVVYVAMSANNRILKRSDGNMEIDALTICAVRASG